MSGSKAPNGQRVRFTSRDIAAAAGVSQATVSNVLNRPDIVSEATRERVFAAMRDMSFVVNDSARSLRAGRSRTLGVVALDLTNPFWGDVTRGITDAASAGGYTLLLGSSGENRESEAELLRTFEEHRVDAVLVSPVAIDSPALASLEEHGIAVVLLDELDPSGRRSAVSLDHEAGARLATEHLLAQGHRRIGFVNVPHNISWSRERLRGLQAAVEAVGPNVDAAIIEAIVPTMTSRAAEPAVEELLAAAPDISAIVCLNDMIAFGVLKRLNTLGIAVPGDVSVVGFDDNYFADLLSPGLTTVRHQPYVLGRTATELAIHREPSKAPVSIILEPELVVRATTAPPDVKKRY